jgi:hypothetical protein
LGKHFDGIDGRQFQAIPNGDRWIFGGLKSGEKN